ncbi:MAG: hypothetical protein PF495_16540 [Spirochaetales bacterium]|jgi:sugar phosphate isomerase/epimerase|nr:hypothetical protein [Spirochaetales bacterium]
MTNLFPLKTKQFGIPTLMEAESIDQMIDLCLEIGAGFIELNTNFPLYLQHNLIETDALNKLAEKGLSCSIHLPEMLDLGSFQPELRLGALGMLGHLVDIVPPETRFIAHMNTGIPVSLPDRKVFLYDYWNKVFLEALRKSAYECSRILERKSCCLCMENIGNFSLKHIQDGLKVLLEQESIGLIWDVGHDTTAGITDTPFFLEHIEKVAELHVHDSLRGNDHLPLFTGKTDILQALSLASQRKLPVVVEVKTAEGLKRSFITLSEKGLVSKSYV